MEFIDFKRAVYKQFDALANNADRLYLTNVNNKLVSIWDSLVLDEPYATVARNLAQLVKSKPVCDVFVSKVVKGITNRKFH